jgi:hypothetical protein
VTAVTWIPRRSKLTAMIDRPGGVSVGVALTRAQANLDALAGRSQVIVAERVGELAALTPPPSPEDVAGRIDQAYAAANAIIDAAGPFERQDICGAAAGLCDLLDAAAPGEPFDWRIVTVHAQALRLLLVLPADATEDRRQVVENLRDVVEHKLGARQPAA